jgi:spore coat protein A
MTRLNVYAGLTGILILEDKNSHLSTIFDSKHDISLMITDKTFNKDGSLYYPDEAESNEF